MDKLLDSGVDINLVDRVSYVLMIFILLLYQSNPICEGSVNYISVADTGWLHLSSQGCHREKRGCH
jgi:hypothetical protein